MQVNLILLSEIIYKIYFKINIFMIDLCWVYSLFEYSLLHIFSKFYI